MNQIEWQEHKQLIHWKLTKNDLPPSYPDKGSKVFFTDNYNNLYFGGYCEYYPGNSEFVINTVIDIRDKLRVKKAEDSLYMNDEYQECKWWADCRIFPIINT